MTELREPPAAEPTRQRRRRWPWAGACAVVGLVVFVLIWFQPQKLFIDERVDAPIPVATAPTTDPGAPAGAAPTAPAEPVDVANGTFVSLDHGTSGTVRILELADGSRVLRLEDLDTDNGPDLYVYLSTNPSDGDESTFVEDFVNLGRLQGNLGNQNYDLPAGIDLTRYASVVIWCDRFDSAFGAADLR
jgi:hypothetical protein